MTSSGKAAPVTPKIQFLLAISPVPDQTSTSTTMLSPSKLLLSLSLLSLWASCAEMKVLELTEETWKDVLKGEWMVKL